MSRYRLDTLIDADQEAAALPRRYAWLLRASPARLLPVGDEPRGLRLVLALEQLGERERACVVLSFFQGLSNVAIAEELGCSEATVRRAVAHGVVKLGQLVGDLDDPL